MERLYLKPALCKAIEEYCKLNNIEDINNFANRCATQGFSIVKYGLSPPDNINRENNGIKDLKKNEKTIKKKKDIGSEIKGEQVKPEESSGVEERKEDSQPVEKAKSSVTVRKIRVIKKK
jgi:hypothetical protein